MRKVSGLPRVMVLGPSTSAVSGVATHLGLLLRSGLADEYSLYHFRVGSEGRNETALMKVVRFSTSPLSIGLNILKMKPSIMHVNTSIDRKAFWRDAVYLLVGKLLRCRVVYQVHGGELPIEFAGGKAWLAAVIRHVLTVPDAIVLLARREFEAYSRLQGLKRLLLIPNAIDIQAYRPCKPRDYSESRLIVGYIGRLAEGKGLAELVEACAVLRGKCDFELQLAGTGPLEAALRVAVTSAGIADRVQFRGALYGEEKIEFWRTIDLFIFPTHREGLPYAVLESLASGTPMITTAVGGIPDVVADGEHARIVEPGDPAMLAQTIEAVLQDRDWLKSASQKCLKQAHAVCGLDRLEKQFSQLYRSLLP